MGFVANYIRNLPAAALGRQPARPLLFSYYVTHRCDLFCTYCSDGSGRPFKEDVTAELDTAAAKQLISILRRETDTLNITGGEPLVRDDLEELLAHATEIGFRTMLNTKGIGLDQRADVMRFCDVLVLSVDAMAPPALARIIGHQEPTARRILEAVQFALSGCDQTGTKVVLAAVATPDNLEDAADVLRFASDHSLGFELSPQIVATKAHPALDGNPRYTDLVNEAVRVKRQGGRVCGVRRYWLGIRDFRPFRCHPLLMPTVRPDGRLYYPCLESGQAEVSLLEKGSYGAALAAARRGRLTTCGDRCHLLCHMGLSLLQRHPLSALREFRYWRHQPWSRT